MAIEGVSVAFDDPALEPDPTWTRLDSTPNLVASYEIRRGRQDEFEKTGTGTARFLINDTSGDFDATNASSPYFGTIDGRQAGIALRNPVTDTWHTIFRGFIDGYEFDVEPSGVVIRTAADLVDALDFLAGAELAPGNGHPPPPESAGEVFYEDGEVNLRILAALGDAGWPVELTTVFSGNVNVKETVYPPGTAVLQVIQDAADAEWPGVANIYVSNEGKVTFHGRHARFDPDSVAAGAGAAWDFTRWQAGSHIDTIEDFAQIRGLAYARSRKQIVNAAMALPFRPGIKNVPGEPPTAPLTAAETEGQLASDAPSVTAYGVHSWSATDLITEGHKTNGTNDLEETRLFSDYYVGNYAQPQTRLTRLVFRSIRPDDIRGPATWDLLCGVEVSDIVRLTTLHPGGGGFAADEFYVEGISYDVRPLNADYPDVTLSLDVSPSGYYTVDPFGDT